jgi:translation initiation factor 2 beta subunit (eIF-2beta)/eIF-5
MLNYGYQFKLIRGYEFSKIDLFSEYVNHFYNIKKSSTGSKKFIAKMHLNQLYGIFGRRKDIIETINIHRKDLESYLTTRIIKTIIEINDNKLILLVQSNLNSDIITKLNNYFETDFINKFIQVKNNVAIASAVTSYARIHMISFKNDDNVLYTDTDSILTTKKLDDSLIDSNKLGYMKDELNGKVIKEAYFLGIKQYGYYYKDDNNKIIEKSVFAGVTRNSLTFDEIKEIHNNKTITKTITNRFYKSLTTLNISIKNEMKLIITRTNTKKLINNYYYPPKINNNLKIFNFFEYLKNKILKHITKIFKI